MPNPRSTPPAAPAAPAVPAIYTPPPPEDNWETAAPNQAVAKPNFSFPTAQWLHGRSDLEETGGLPYTGGLVIVAAGLPDGEYPGWNPANKKWQNGKKESLLHNPAPRIAVLRTRFRWVTRQTEGPAEDNAKKGAQNSNLHILAAIQGIDTPVVITLAKKSKTEPFFNALKAFREAVVKPANIARAAQARRQNTPVPLALSDYAFWLPLVAGPHDMAKSKASSASSEVTPPVLHLPALKGAELFKSLYVGQNDLRLFEDWYLQTEGWEKAWAIHEALPAPEEPDFPEDGDNF